MNAAGGLNFGYLMIFITGYYPEIGIGAGTIGLILGAEGAAMVTFAVPLGLYSDRYGRKVPLVAAASVLPLIALVFVFTTETLWLVLAAIVAGVAEGGLLATWNAMIADQTTPKQRDAAFALSFILGSVAGGAGFALPIAFPFLEASTGLDSHTIHVATFVVTDAFAFLIPSPWSSCCGGTARPCARERPGRRGRTGGRSSSSPPSTGSSVLEPVSSFPSSRPGCA